MVHFLRKNCLNCLKMVESALVSAPSGWLISIRWNGSKKYRAKLIQHSSYTYMI
jgi:hypothetical protein